MIHSCFLSVPYLSRQKFHAQFFCQILILEDAYWTLRHLLVRLSYEVQIRYANMDYQIHLPLDSKVQYLYWRVILNPYHQQHTA